MNRCFRVIWSNYHQAAIAVSELARCSGRRISKVQRCLPALALMSVPYLSIAGPQLDAVTSGEATVAASKDNPKVLEINQTSNVVSINWKNFTIASDETVKFKQTNPNAIAVNSVIRAPIVDPQNYTPTLIQGSLQAVGKIWIIDSHGVVIGSNAVVEVGSFLASTLIPERITDLESKPLKLTEAPVTWERAGILPTILNEGKIIANDGHVTLLGEKVINNGMISAKAGNILLGSGAEMTLQFDEKGPKVVIDKGTKFGFVSNAITGTIQGKSIIMSARTADNIINNAVNNDGVIEAIGIQANGRSIELTALGNGAALTLGGVLKSTATSPTSIATTGDRVSIKENFALFRTSGSAALDWVIESNLFRVGGNAADVSADKINSALRLGDVLITGKSKEVNSISRGGDVTIQDPLSWPTDNKLQLHADRDLVIGADIHSNGSAAALHLKDGNGGYSMDRGARISIGGGSSLVIDDKVYTLVSSLAELNTIRSNLGGQYALRNDVDASASKDANQGKGFLSIGNEITKFTGTLDGLGHTIKGLKINDGSVQYVGLVGFNAGLIKNIGLKDVSVFAANYAGALTGQNDGIIQRVYVDGNSSVKASQYVGGLIGLNRGSVVDAFSTSTVEGVTDVGGLIGRYQRDFSISGVSNAYATGAVRLFSFYGGGLIGSMSGGVPRDSNNHDLSDAYAAGAVTRTFGTIDVNDQIGTLVGIANSVFIRNVAGLKKSADGTNLNLIGASNAVVLTSTKSFDLANREKVDAYPVLDLAGTWRIYEGATTPLLRTFLRPVTISAAPIVKEFNGQPYTGAITEVISESGVELNGLPGFGGTWRNAVNAGTYTIEPLEKWSTQYDITPVNSTLTVLPKTLSVALTGLVGKVYDGSTSLSLRPPSGSAASFQLSGLVGTDSLSLSGLPEFASLATASAGPSQTVSVSLSGVTLSGSQGLPSNYRLPNEVQTTVAITPRPLTISASGLQPKIYDGTRDIAIAADRFLITGAVQGETIALRDPFLTGQLDSKDAGLVRQITVPLAEGAFTTSANTSISNYRFSNVTTTASILPRMVEVKVADSYFKTYDGNASIDLDASGLVLSGVVPGERLTMSNPPLIGTYNSPNVAEARTISASLADTKLLQDGQIASNYTLPLQFSANGVIKPRPLDVSITGLPTKIYDGTSFITLGSGTFSIKGLINNESISLVSAPGSGQLNSPNVMQATQVNASLTPANFVANTNTALSNYLLPVVASGPARILPAALKLTASTATIVSDSPLPPLRGSVSGFVGGDSLESATTGVLRWRPASPYVQDGLVAVKGEGLTANFGNYVFEQDPVNAYAIRVLPRQTCAQTSAIDAVLEARAVGSTRGSLRGELAPGTPAQWLIPGTATVRVSGGGAC